MPNFRWSVHVFSPGGKEAPDAEPQTVIRTMTDTALQSFPLMECLERLDEQTPGGIGLTLGCRRGRCGSCGCMINGSPALICQTVVSAKNPVFRLAPLDNFTCIRGLQVAHAPLLNDLARVWALKASPTNPAVVPACIHCGLCTAACPNANRLQKQASYPGLLAMQYRLWKAAQLEETLLAGPPASQEGALWECAASGRCTQVCPRRLPVASYLQQAKLGRALKAVFSDTTVKQLLPYLAKTPERTPLWQPSTQCIAPWLYQLANLSRISMIGLSCMVSLIQLYALGSQRAVAPFCFSCFQTGGARVGLLLCFALSCAHAAHWFQVLWYVQWGKAQTCLKDTVCWLLSMLPSFCLGGAAWQL